jgi:hypothetical protein
VMAAPTTTTTSQDLNSQPNEATPQTDQWVSVLTAGLICGLDGSFAGRAAR